MGVWKKQSKHSRQSSHSRVKSVLNFYYLYLIFFQPKVDFFSILANQIQTNSKIDRIAEHIQSQSLFFYSLTRHSSHSKEYFFIYWKAKVGIVEIIFSLISKPK